RDNESRRSESRFRPALSRPDGRPEREARRKQQRGGTRGPRRAAASVLWTGRTRKARRLSRAKAGRAIFLFVHGGSWRGGSARNNADPAEKFVNAGANFIAVHFVDIKQAGGGLRPVAPQVRNALALGFKESAPLRPRADP